MVRQTQMTRIWGQFNPDSPSAPCSGTKPEQMLRRLDEIIQYCGRHTDPVLNSAAVHWGLLTSIFDLESDLKSKVERFEISAF